MVICITTQTAFHTVYSHVLLCCHYSGFAFTSSHLRPALTQLMVNCATLFLAAIQNLIGMVGADFNLVTFEQCAPSGGNCGSPEDVVITTTEAAQCYLCIVFQGFKRCYSRRH